MQQTVLIIDDEVDLCLMVRKYLNHKGYMVYMAHTLADGLKKLSTLKPDILILDNKLPDGSGWNEVENINNDFPDMRITLISGYGTPKELLFPDMPVTIVEKPLSVKDIEATFS